MRRTAFFPGVCYTVQENAGIRKQKAKALKAGFYNNGGMKLEKDFPYYDPTEK